MLELAQQTSEAQENIKLVQELANQSLVQQARTFRGSPEIPQTTQQLLAPLELVQGNPQDNPNDHRVLVHKFAMELEATLRITPDLRQYLADAMNSGGQNALNWASREINEDMIRSTKRLPAEQQLRLIYGVSRDQQTGERLYSVTLLQHQNNRALDAIAFPAS